MALVNHTTREINAKIVYYGPGLCGKTTNIHFIFHRISPNQRGKLISLATEADRTLFFDFLPIELGNIKGYKVRFHLYTVPGQVFYNATRKLVLKGADGVIFVADSQRAMLDANQESLANLRENFRDQGVNLDDFPMVLQYNKRDLPDVLSLDELSATLNRRRMPAFEAVAKNGDGVLKTFTAISKLVLQDMQKHPEKHSVTLGDIAIKTAEQPVPSPFLTAPEPSMPGAPMVEAKAEMAALAKAVDAGMKLSVGKAVVQDGQIVLPFGIQTADADDKFQLRVTIDMKAPMAKRFKVLFRGVKKE